MDQSLVEPILDGSRKGRKFDCENNMCAGDWQSAICAWAPPRARGKSLSGGRARAVRCALMHCRVLLSFRSITFHGRTANGSTKVFR